MFIEGDKERLVLEGVREYRESIGVWLCEGVEAIEYEYVKREGRWDIDIKQSRPVLAVVAENEGGYNSTAVDLLDLLRWVKKNRPHLLEEVVQEGN